MSKKMSKMETCQKDVKCQNVKHQEVHKKLIDIMRLTDIDINFDVTYEYHQNWSKIVSVDILSVFAHHHM